MLALKLENLIEVSTYQQDIPLLKRVIFLHPLNTLTTNQFSNPYPCIRQWSVCQLLSHKVRIRANFHLSDVFFHILSR